MKRDRYGGADWVETQKAVLQDMMLREFGWERFYKGSNPRGNLLLSDYRREKAAEMAKEEERKLEDIKDKVATGHAAIQAQAEQLEVMLESLDKGAEAEKQLSVRITDKNAELDDVLRKLADKSTELDEVKQDLTDKKSEVRDQELKAENRSLRAKLQKAYDFMRQFTINGMNMLKHFLRSIGEWIQQKVAGISR